MFFEFLDDDLLLGDGSSDKVGGFSQQTGSVAALSRESGVITAQPRAAAMSGLEAQLPSQKTAEKLQIRCVFCSALCSHRQPSLLSCLHSACTDCLAGQLAAEQSTTEVIDVEGGGEVELLAELEDGDKLDF